MHGIQGTYQREAEILLVVLSSTSKGDILQNSETAYIAFGCGSEALILLIPANEFVQWLDGLNQTVREDRFYWHVHLSYDGVVVMLNRKKEYDAIDLTKYILI